MSSPPTPSGKVSEQQAQRRRGALARATQRRAALKATLRQSSVSAADLIAAPPEWLISAKILDVLLALPNRGCLSAMGLLVRCRVSPAKRIGSLTWRQRNELGRALKRRAGFV
jgi:hypothetical protein